MTARKIKAKYLPIEPAIKQQNVLEKENVSDRKGTPSSNFPKILSGKFHIHLEATK